MSSMAPGSSVTTSSPSRSGQDENLSILTISDFSPGIYRYSLGGAAGMPTTYAVNAPLGSAASAFRCINKPGVGLIPFPDYSSFAAFTFTPTQSETVIPPVFCCGLGAVGAMSTTFPIGLTSPFKIQDLVVVELSFRANWTGSNGTNNPSNAAFRFVPNTSGAAFFATPEQLSEVHNNTFASNPLNIYTGAIFAQSQFTYTGDPNISYKLVWVDGGIAGAAAGEQYTPSQTANSAQIISNNGSGSEVVGYGVYGHEGRLITFLSNGTAEFSSSNGGANGLQALNNESIAYTDPPFTATYTANPSTNSNSFPAESASGYGAWGSVSTGELFMVRQGFGGMVVTGDFAAPSSATKLPAVIGTGRLVQRATMCSVGLVYVTEADGVYAWNGGNTSAKISTQIPDDACVRTDLTPANCTGGNIHHDVQNNLVFFANNWVFDSINNSWWNCEDPSVLNLAVFARSSSTSEFMWAMNGTGTGASQNTFNLYGFDFETRANNWVWVSNPLPVSVGNLISVSWVEIVASNPTSSPCTITITPTAPPGQTPIAAGNQPQSVTFSIPPLASGYRESSRLGYTDYNVELSITANNPNTALAAPVLHSINIGYANDGPTGPN